VDAYGGQVPEPAVPPDPAEPDLAALERIETELLAVERALEALDGDDPAAIEALLADAAQRLGGSTSSPASSMASRNP
jgi:hypothetical protein